MKKEMKITRNLLGNSFEMKNYIKIEEMNENEQFMSF